MFLWQPSQACNFYNTNNIEIKSDLDGVPVALCRPKMGLT